MMKWMPSFGLVLMLVACDGSQPAGGGGGHSHEGTHGGDVLDISGGTGHMEIVHDDDAGTMTIYILGSDAKSAMPLATTPQFKILTDDGATVIDAEAVEPAADGKSAVFKITNDALKTHEVAGRISLEIGGKVYNTEYSHKH